MCQTQPESRLSWGFDNEKKQNLLTDGTDTLNDIALMEFDHALRQDQWRWNTTDRNAIYPICLPDENYDEINKASG